MSERVSEQKKEGVHKSQSVAAAATHPFSWFLPFLTLSLS